MSAPKMMPALLGGLFIGVLSSLPYIKGGNVCCCLWVISGGVLAAWLMQQNTPRPVTVGEGALVGLLLGRRRHGRVGGVGRPRPDRCSPARRSTWRTSSVR